MFQKMLGLLFLAAIAAALTSHPEHAVSLEADHESLLSVKDPCSSGETAFDNGVAVHPNGCGSGSVQAAIVKYTIPYSTTFTSCCNVHDTCFGTCAIHNFSQAF